MDRLRYYDEKSHFRRRSAEDRETRFWNSAEGQRRRFDAVLKCISGSVLDVGCGDGAFLRRAVETGRAVVPYYGLDFVPEFLIEAEGALKDSGLLGGLFDWDAAERPWPIPPVDWCVAIGLFWAVQESEALWVSRYEAITKEMWRLAEVGIAVTLTSALSPKRDPAAFYADPGEEVRRFMGLFGSRVVLDHSYLPNDFLLVAYREGA